MPIIEEWALKLTCFRGEKMNLKTCCLFTAFLLSLESQAQFLKLDELGHGGIGCTQAGPAQAPKVVAKLNTLPSEEAGTQAFGLEVQFPTFGLISHDTKRAACAVAIPFELESGKKLILKKLTIFGGLDLPAESVLKTSAIATLTGVEQNSKLLQALEEFSGPLAMNYFATSDGNSDVLVESGCGVSGNLRINGSLFLKTSEESMADLGFLQLGLKIVDC